MSTIYFRATATRGNPVPSWHIQKPGSQSEALCGRSIADVGGLQELPPAQGVCWRCVDKKSYKAKMEARHK